MENEKRAKYLLIDEDGFTKLAIESGLYPELTKELEHGDLMVADHNEAKNLLNQNAIESIEDNGYYMLNPYCGNLRYELASSKGLELRYINDKMETVKNILIMMGAKSIKMVESEKSTSHQTHSGQIEFSVPKSQGGLSGRSDKNEVEKFFSKATYDDSQNKAIPCEDIEREIVRTGLTSVSFFGNCLNRLRSGNPLTGKHTMEYSSLGEVKKGFEIGAKLKVVRFKTEVDYQQLSEETHEFTTTLEVDFG